MRPLILLAVLFLLAACVPIPPPTDVPQPVGSTEYNLGETTITQGQFPADSRFREMPVRLNGVIAVPQGQGPFPVIVILHGTHPGCPAVGEVDAWPCSPEEERNNYRGFAYLTEFLAQSGYVALSINVNAEYTFGFGEPVGGERMAQLVKLHLAALDAASQGGENKFGVALKGKADVGRVGLVGHSRAGELALEMAREETGAEAAALAPDTTNRIRAVLQVAPSPVSVDPALGSPVPLGIILPMCDGDVQDLSGQVFYEGARLAPAQTSWINSVFLDRANHNGFNTMLGRDPFGLRGRPDCATLLTPETQQRFLDAYAVTFFDAAFAGGPKSEQALTGLGMDARLPAPDTLGGLVGRVAALYPAEKRIVLLTPPGEAELTTHQLGGAVTAEGVTTFFCPEGYYTPFMKPGSEPCRRANVTIPGNPALVVLNWEGAGALRFAVPPGRGDWRDAAAISLRVAVDPLSPLNAKDRPVAFAVRVTDGKGGEATVKTREDEPALRFPVGELMPDESFGDLFTGKAPLTTVRLLKGQFAGVDWSDAREVALVFEGTGALFVADVEAVR